MKFEIFRSRSIIFIVFMLLSAVFSFPAGGQEPQTDEKENRAESGLFRADNRVALVIGNGDYLNGPLNNTVNDARSMARALRASGFEVILSENLSNKDEMKRVVRDFGAKLRNGGTGLFYYAGHGLQLNGFNYIVPVNAVINIQQEVEYECLDVGFVLAYMESAETSVNIVILDACRNNPFARSFRSTQQGLVGMTAPTGTIIGFATAPGSVASDGTGVNGLYTQELLRQINTPGLKVEDVFKNVRRNVVEKSGGTQTPWESSSLIGDFYFSGVDEGAVERGGAEGNALAAQADLAGEPGEGAKQPGDEGGKPIEATLKETEALTNENPGETSSWMKPAENIQGNETKPAYQPRNSINTGEEFTFRWKGKSTGEFFIKVDGEMIESGLSHEVSGDNLIVTQKSTGRVFVLKAFANRMDGLWRKGKGKQY